MVNVGLDALRSRKSGELRSGGAHSVYPATPGAADRATESGQKRAQDRSVGRNPDCRPVRIADAAIVTRSTLHREAGAKTG